MLQGYSREMGSRVRKGMRVYLLVGQNGMGMENSCDCA
jgi:hypothetical protein